MIRQVRVILSAEVGRFTGGIRNAIGVFAGFSSGVMSGARSVISFLSDIGNIVSGVSHGFSMLAGAARGLWDTFVQGAITEERFTRTIATITGSTEQASSMTEFLRDKSKELGVAFNDLLPSAQQVAVALRAQDGEVDPDKWQKLTMAIIKFSALRPDVPVQFWGRAISGLLTGDVQTLTRLLDVSVKDMGMLSDEVKAFLTDSSSAQEQQLGKVTRLGEEAGKSGSTAMQALDEILNAVGATDEMLDAQASSTEGKLDILRALWKDFTDDVGVEMLPIISTALDKIITFVTEHEEDIAKFVDQFGNIATEGFEKLMEWIDSGAAAEFAESLGDIGKAGGDIKAAFDWLAKAASDIDKIVGTINSLYENVTGGPAPGGFDPLAVNKNAPLQKILNGETPTIGGSSESMPPWMKAVGDWFKNATNPEAQRVEVSVKVDDDGKLRAVIEKTTSEKLEELITNTTGGGPGGER